MKTDQKKSQGSSHYDQRNPNIRKGEENHYDKEEKASPSTDCVVCNCVACTELKPFWKKKKTEE